MASAQVAPLDKGGSDGGGESDGAGQTAPDTLPPLRCTGSPGLGSKTLQSVSPALPKSGTDNHATKDDAKDDGAKDRGRSGADNSRGAEASQEPASPKTASGKVSRCGFQQGAVGAYGCQRYAPRDASVFTFWLTTSVASRHRVHPHSHSCPLSPSPPLLQEARAARGFRSQESLLPRSQLGEGSSPTRSKPTPPWSASTSAPRSSHQWS